jgi:molybdenum cofactor cytidylyltransferase
MKSRKVGTAALILAAGASSRMGRPKALLYHPVSGLTFIRHLIGVFGAGGAAPVVVVTRPDDIELARQVVEAKGVVAENADPTRGQLSSLQTGVTLIEGTGCAGVLMTPVDLPLISSDVIARLIAAAGTGSPIVRPTWRGRGGHPVYFGSTLFGELLRADPAIGARGVVRADPGRVLDLEVGDPGILIDVDTPEDYQRLREV